MDAFERHLASLIRSDSLADLEGIRHMVVIEAFAEVCRDSGPWEVAAAVKAPADDFRTVAYLFAAAVLPSEDRDCGVAAAIEAFDEWALAEDAP